jgi:hypothetical protein
VHRNKFALGWIAFLAAFSIAWDFAPEPEANKPTGQISFTLKDTRNVRDDRLQLKGRAKAGGKVTIDPKFLLKYFGTETPSIRQLRNLLFDPVSVSKRISPRRYFDPDAKRYLYEYFFPIRVENPDGSVAEGQMALAATFRTGNAKMNIPVEGQVPVITEDRETMAIIESRVKIVAEPPVARVCEECQKKRSNGPLGDLAEDMAPLIDGAAEGLWNEYVNFAREFSSRNSRAIQQRPHRLKKQFLSELVNRFGAERAGRIAQALTAFGEAPTRDHDAAQLAELAGVTRVIENRAKSGFRHDSRALRDIGLADADPRLSASLANWQFSVWNEGDNSLPRMLSFNPDIADPLTKRRMHLAFVAQGKMESGQIEFLGQMARPDVFHYHANYVWPGWSRAGNRVGQALIRVRDVRANGTIEFVDVDLSRQPGARHIFYAGLR